MPDFGELFWECRKYWPTDEWFTYDRFGEAPVGYVFKAVAAGRNARREELHEHELPVANLAALMANINRDAKRVKKPYTTIDFCFWASKEDQNRPDEAPAAAYMAMAKAGVLPRWALFIYQDMKHGNAAAAVDPCAAVGEHVLLLAPQMRNGGLEGLLIATNEASNQHVEIIFEDKTYTVAVPEFDGWAVAREHVYLPIM